jgi:WD40 repeat protein
VAFDGVLRQGNLVLSPKATHAAAVLYHNRKRPQIVPADSLGVWDLRTNSLKMFEVDGLTTVAWTGDGKSIILGTEAGRVFLQDLESESRVTTMDEVAGGVNCVAASADGRLGAALGEECEVFVWEIGGSDWRTKLTPSLPSRPMLLPRFNDLGFSPDGRLIAVFFGDGHMCCGPVGGHQLPVVFTASDDRKESVSKNAIGWLPDGRLLALRATGTKEDRGYGPYCIRVWDVPNARLLWASPAQRHPISALELSPDGQTLVSGSWDGTALLWDLSKIWDS